MKTMGMTGKKHTEATKKKISDDSKQKWLDGRMTIEIIRPFLKAGSDANRGKPNLKIAGNKSHLWKGGITKEHDRIRTSLEYKLWARAVKLRDNFTCVKCGDVSGKGNYVYLHSDHIKPFATHPESRFAIDNGQTLCKSYHAKKTSNDMKVMRRITYIWR